ncbi:MAG TPA: isocitrate lyase, partial [Flavobacteriales bacterium]|nr:isocitrate lyase [Flavobacteriales bacterium]
MTRQEQISELIAKWSSDERWEGIERTYTAEDVVKLRGTVRIEHTLAR